IERLTNMALKVFFVVLLISCGGTKKIPINILEMASSIKEIEPPVYSTPSPLVVKLPLPQLKDKPHLQSIITDSTTLKLTNIVSTLTTELQSFHERQITITERRFAEKLKTDSIMRAKDLLISKQADTIKQQRQDKAVEQTRMYVEGNLAKYFPLI